MLTSDDGRWVTLIDTLRPDEASAVRRNDLQDDDAFYAYYQDLTGRWFYTRAVYQGLVWADGLDVANTFRGRIRGWRIPRPARRELRRTGETSWDHYQAISSYLTLRGWALRARNTWIAIRIDLPRWLANIPDERRQQRFAGRPNTIALVPDAEERGTWPVDLTYDIDCWKGPRSARQFACGWEGEYLVCEIELRSGPIAPVQGLVCLRRDAFDALPTSPANSRCGANLRPTLGL